MNQDKSSDKSRPHADERAPTQDAAGGPDPSAETGGMMGLPAGTIKKIGRYAIKRVIASGGMGTVYEAVQEQPRRTVAIKMMNRGLASPSALRRFEYEAQLLARLSHPCIAQVYEAGTHEDASGPVPYFAMEYIPNAKSITGYAADKKLTTRERLELFARVCDAVHHGHQKGIIHRDLKPSNILVDSRGNPRIIDFGVARSIDSDMAVTALQTNVGQLVGTIQYMSPEQCEADPHDIDTRSDVYALGIVLYELLCEQLPYDVTRLSLSEAARRIRQQNPPKVGVHQADLRGDVETIVLKAHEKERDRRYQSAFGLAQDIRRYLSGEAIVARPPSIVYQLRVFARRNKAVFGATAAAFVVLAAGVVVSTLLYTRAEANRVKAEDEAGKALAAVDFLQSMLWTADPSRVGPEVRVVDLLDRFGGLIDVAFDDQPEIEAGLRTTLGLAYQELGMHEPADTHLTSALEIREGLLGIEHPDTLTSFYNLAGLRHDQGRLDEVEPLTIKALDIRRRVLGEEHPDTLSSMNELAWLRQDQGKLAEAEHLKRQVLKMRRRVLGEDHSDTVESIGDLAHTLLLQRKLSEAADLYRGKQAPDGLGIETWFQGEGEVDLSNPAGTLLLFWEVWCPYCQHAVPELQETYARFKDRGLQVVGLTEITNTATPERVRDYIRAQGVSYPVAKQDGSASTYFNVAGVPSAALLKGGRLVWFGHPARISDELISGCVGGNSQPPTAAEGGLAGSS
jgi:tetratricopeptide (TPR) repeat protein